MRARGTGEGKRNKRENMDAYREGSEWYMIRVGNRERNEVSEEVYGRVSLTPSWPVLHRGDGGGMQYKLVSLSIIRGCRLQASEECS